MGGSRNKELSQNRAVPARRGSLRRRSHPLKRYAVLRRTAKYGLTGRRRRLIEGRGDDGGVEPFELERLDSGLRPKLGHQV